MPLRVTRVGGQPWKMLIACLLLGGFAWAAPAPVTPQARGREYQVKAVFLFNFTQFIEWPEDSFEHATAPLVIGVLGEDPFGPYLDETVRGEVANGRPLVIERYHRLEEIGHCQVLFVSGSEANRLEQIFARLNGKRVLTVGDVDRFIGRGGVIRFATTAGKLRLRINLNAARAAGLTISSKLLRPAEIVEPGQD